MSKSKGNVIDPLNIVDLYGADTLRTYVLFMSDYTAAAPWSDEGVRGCKRFLDRVAGLTEIMTAEKEDSALESKIHKTIKKVSEDIERMKFNTAIAAMMALINDYYKAGSITRNDLEIFLKLLSQFAPHITEEIWSELGNDGFVTVAAWPEYDEEKTKDSVINYGVQVNGKLKGNIDIPAEAGQEEAVAAAKADAGVARALDGKTIVKTIFVKGKILNFVVR
jgi:leucyl-tRNA synthetase